MVAIAAGVLILSGDGKGSGDIERAFGRVSFEDERLVTDASVHHAAILNGMLAMIGSGTRGDLRDATGKADQTLGSIDGAADAIERIDNTRLRESFTDLLRSRRAFVTSYLDLVTYACEHPRGSKARALRERVRQAAVGMHRADQRMIARVRPYMTAEQASELRRAQERNAERFTEAVGG